MARILIFEDELDIAALYRMELEDRGHLVLGVHADPGELLSSPEKIALRPAPDIIVLDDRLGELSGITFVPQFRKAFPLVRIILVSADPEALEGGRLEGVDKIARKPVPLRSLVDEMESMLAHPTS